MWRRRPSRRVVDADRALAVEVDLVDEGVRLDAQVLPVTHGPEVRARRGHPPAAVDVPVELREPLLPVAVDVVRQRVAGLLRRLEERPEQRVLGRPALEQQRTVAAAPVVGTGQAGLHPLEVRQAVQVVPRLHAGVGGPPLVVHRVAALEDHPVDAAGAAEHLAAGVEDLAAVHVRLGVGLVLPVVEPVADRDRQGRRHVDERVLAVVATSGLEHQDRRGRIGAQPVGDGRSRGAAADDHVVPVIDWRHGAEPVLGLGGDVVPDVLGLAVLLEADVAELAADAGLLVAAPLGLGDVRVVVVDPHRAHAQPGRDALALAGVAGPHRTGESVDAVVGDADRVVLAGEGLDREHRPERLVLGDAHVAGAVVEHGGQVVEAVGELGVVRPLAAAAQLGALGQAGRHVGLDLVAVRGTGEWAGLGLLVERAAEADALGPLDEVVDEPVVQRLLDHQPRAGRADLAGVQEDGGEGEVEGGVVVGVGEDDVGVLAAQLEGDPLHRARRRGHDALAGGQAAGERHQVDARVLAQRGSGVRAVAEHQVGDAGGKTRLVEQLHQVDRGVRGELAGLEDEGVAGGEAGRDLPGDLQERVVPRRDQAADADRLVHDPADHAGVAGVDHPAGLGIGDVTEVPDDRHHVGDVVLALDQTLAGVERLGLGDDRGVALEQVGEPEQEVAALPGGGGGPGSGVEGGACCGDGGVGVVGSGLVDLSDQGAVRGAADLAASARAGTHPCPADPVLRHTTCSPRVAHSATDCSWRNLDALKHGPSRVPASSMYTRLLQKAPCTASGGPIRAGGRSRWRPPGVAGGPPRSWRRPAGTSVR